MIVKLEASNQDRFNRIDFLELPLLDSGLMPHEKVRARMLISGRVQGVCFRMYMEDEARRHGVTGWVRNLPTGQVESVCEGEKEGVEQVVRWAHRGPPAAHVEDVEVTWEPFQGDLAGFRIV